MANGEHGLVWFIMEAVRGRTEDVVFPQPFSNQGRGRERRRVRKRGDEERPLLAAEKQRQGRRVRGRPCPNLHSFLLPGGEAPLQAAALACPPRMLCSRGPDGGPALTSLRAIFSHRQAQPHNEILLNGHFAMKMGPFLLQAWFFAATCCFSDWTYFQNKTHN